VFRIDNTEFRTFRTYLRKACGLVFTDEKYPQVAEAVGSRMSELGVQSFDEYQRLVTSASSGSSELSALATKLTVGETYFFRNTEHWRAFEQCVVPWLVELNAATGRRRVRIWSAGCSTGEEAYTMAIALRRSLPDLANWSIEIVGTDISPAALATANEAVYTENSFRGVSQEIRSQYFGRAGRNRYRLRDDIRNMVRFQQLNLLDVTGMAPMRDFDVIFCRNVLIYFEPSAIQNVVMQFHHSLRPGGYLFLGHAESTHGRSPGFASLNLCNTFIYKSMPRPTSDHVGHDSIVPGTLETGPANTRKTHGQIEAQSTDCVEERSLALQSRVQEPPGISALESQATKCATSMSVSEDVESPFTYASGHREPHENGSSCRDDRVDRVATVPPRVEASTPPEPVQAPETPTLDDLREQAIEHILAEEIAQAQQALDAVLRQEPDDAETLLGKALLLAGAGDNDAALACGQQVLDANSMCAEAHCVMALVYEGLGQTELARRELDKAIYLDGGFAIAHFRLACLHGRTGRRDDAMREFFNTIKALPHDDQRRVRLYSGGFDTETISRLCGQQLGIEAASEGT